LEREREISVIMPTASTAALRGGAYATTYGTSFTASSVRSSSATRRTSSLSNGYSSPSNATTQYRTSRPLPTGPGPLDSRGQRLDPGFSTYTSSRARGSPVGSGLSSTKLSPLKADRGATSYSRYNNSTSDRTTSDYLSTHTLNRKNSRASLEPISTTTTTSGVGTGSSSRLTGRRSASLANLRLDDDSPTYSRSQYSTTTGISLTFFHFLFHY
jgi:hypothetical protein